MSAPLPPTRDEFLAATGILSLADSSSTQLPTIDDYDAASAIMQLANNPPTPPAATLYAHGPASRPLPPGVTTQEPTRAKGYHIQVANHTNPGLEAPGWACKHKSTSTSCGCNETPWPASGSLVIPVCAWCCEVCGLFKDYFKNGASNLKRHVVSEHGGRYNSIKYEGARA